jgi:dTDP-4-amino-4,6-dideoxygalactose transaminase
MIDNSVKIFEQKIADFYGCPYAIAVDCCTHGIELCLRYTNTLHYTTPKRTYVSIPMLANKLGIDFTWEELAWEDYYFLGNTNIIDAAVNWKANSYISNTFMCLSFQFQKHLSLGRGGMILTDNIKACTALKKMSYDGRLPDIPWREQNIDSMGYHYYMTPETAKLGLEKLPEAIERKPKKWTLEEWPDLTQMEIFK